jgi:HD-GYP domain-containing protein (c-di-GMP phosphodiesterase class II)
MQRAGRRIIDSIIRNFRLDELPFVDVLRHIVELHHETMDGSGYPLHLKGEEIPIEARIAAVADIFDALTSRRSYKEPWTNDDFIALRMLARSQIDGDCVEALMKHGSRVNSTKISG